MSGGGNPAKSSEKRSAVRADEDSLRKMEATRSINLLFGAGDYGDRTQDQFGGFTKPDGGTLQKRGELADKWEKTKFQLNKNKKPIIIPGEDTAVYEAKKAAFEAERDKNKGLRESLYAGNRDAVLDVNKNKLNKDLSESERQLRFALARSGLFAGSEDIAQHGKQREAYDQGILQSTSLADQSAAGFRGADERTRLDVINQIQGGVDTGTALQNAQRGLELSAQNADANAKGNIVGDVFGDAGLIYQNYNQNQGTQDGRTKYANQTGAFFDNLGKKYSGTKR